MTTIYIGGVLPHKATGTLVQALAADGMLTPPNLVGAGKRQTGEPVTLQCETYTETERVCGELGLTLSTTPDSVPPFTHASATP